MITEEQYERSKKRVRRKLKVMTAVRILTNPPFYYKGTNRFRLIKQCFDEIDKLFDLKMYFYRLRLYRLLQGVLLCLS